MKTISKIFILAAVAGLFASCQQDDIVPDTPDAPTEGYHLTFDGGVGIETGTRASWNDDNGSGNLIFQWDYTPDPDNATESELKMAFVKDGLWLPSEGNNYVTDVKILEHTDPAKAEDKHWAKFETIETYNQEVGDNVYDGHTIYAVTPINDTNASTMVVDVNSGELTATLNMPATFTQVTDQEPDFLRNYMYMYATSIIANGSASLSFRHIPATFRFIITNKRPTEANIKSVQVSLADAASVASKSATINYEGVTFSQDAHTAITTQLGENGTIVQKDAKYTAYALALPLADNTAFNGKKLQFTIATDSEPANEYLSFVLDGSQIEAANRTLAGNGVYNWVGGKSYTIRMSLDDGLLVQDITVDDWNEQDIAGGEAVEWVNGFSETGDYEPAQLNADSYYEIKNGGNLFWFANHVNTVDRTASAVLTADIDLEGRPWTPIGSTGEENNNFRGVFDGQNYTIRGLNVEGGRAGLGFFGEVRTGTVKNFTIYGEVVVNTEVDYVGGVIGSICGLNGENDLERNGAIIQNITSYVNLTAKVHGTGMIGGFVGYANHQSLIEKCSWYGTFDAGEFRVDSGAGGFIGKIQENSSEVTIRNCAAYGTIKTNYAKNSFNNTPTIYMGGFLSFSNTNAQTTLENCLFAGKFERGANLTDEARLGAFGTLRSVKAIKNCYYLADDGLEAVHSDSDLKPGSDNVEITAVTEDELRNNTIATQLGTLWEQGENYPVIKK